MKTAIVTGPTGVLGTALVNALLDKEVEVYAVCHPGSKRSASIQSHHLLNKIDCDMQDYADLPAKIDRVCDAFFHLAWLGTQINSNRMNMYLQNTNIRYTLDAVYAAKKLGCKVFVGAGSQAEYGRINGVIHPDSPLYPISGYGMAKLCAGQMTRVLCHEFGIRHIWPRIVSVYGKNDSPKTLVSTIIAQLKQGKSPKLTAGEQIWDYLYAGDAAEALYLMAEKGRDGAIYVLGSGKPRPLKDFMKDIQQAVNKNVPLGLGEIPYLTDQAMHLEADIETLTHDTGWKPRTIFADGICAVINEVYTTGGGGGEPPFAEAIDLKWLPGWQKHIPYADCG